MKKRCFSVLVIFLFVVQSMSDLNVEAKNIGASVKGKIQEEMEDDAGDYYVESVKGDVFALISSCAGIFDVNKSDRVNMKLGTPFVVFDEECNEQEEIVYYPVVVESARAKVIAVVSFVNTSSGWQYSVDNNWVDELNKVNYANSSSEFIMSVSDGRFQVQEKEKASENSLYMECDEGLFETKQRMLIERMKRWKKVDVEENANKRTLVGYTRNTTSQLGYYYCNIDGAQGQGPYGLCWAASSATIINYLQGSRYTAKNVANKMGIGYNDGGSAKDINNALKKYGVNNYINSNSTLTFEAIKARIKNKYPMAVLGWNSYGNGHAVTLYGYRELADGKYIMLWNSALNNNEGGMTLVPYKQKGLTFSTGATSFTWGVTVYSNVVSYK